MSDVTEQPESPSKGIDRRSALKKAAVGGAIAWSAPTVLSSRVNAVDFVGAGCTAKCGPPSSVTVTGLIEIQPCLPGPPDGPPFGQQDVRAQVVSVNTPTQECGCGGNVSVQLLSPTPNVTVFVVRPKPGNTNQGEFDVLVDISCTDRSGNTIQFSCSPAVATVLVKPGSCNGVPAGTQESFTVDLSCSFNTCFLA